MLRKIVCISSIFLLSNCGDLKVEPLGVDTRSADGLSGEQSFDNIVGKFTNANSSSQDQNGTRLTGDNFYNPKVNYFIDNVKIEQFYHIDSNNKSFSLITKCRFNNEEFAYISIATSPFTYSQVSEHVLLIDVKSSKTSEVKMNLINEHKSKNEVCTSKFQRAKFLLRNETDCFVIESAEGLFAAKVFPVQRRYIFDDQIGG